MVLTEQDVRNRIVATARGQYADDSYDFTFEAMGTRCRILCGGSAHAAKLFTSEALKWIASFEFRYSRFIPTSLISRINDSAGKQWIEIDPETERLLDLCHELHFISQGALDPTALPLIRIWDWKRGSIPHENEVRDALKKVGWKRIQRAPGKLLLPEPGMALDLGGIGKEYAVDYITSLALSFGINSLLVDFGQDIRVHGSPAGGKPLWHVGLQDPTRPNSCWAGLGVVDRAVATSGDYIRHFKSDGRRYGHIIDPRTGYPVSNGVLSVSVVAPLCSLAGALSTAAFILGAQDGIALIDSIWNAEGCVLTERSRIPSRKFYEYVASENKHA
ncbi:MAG: FAD:protein FMN transferase [Limisphaerales bacterium]